MTARVPLFEFMPYGAPELLAAARGHMLKAQAASCALMLALFAAALLLVPRIPHPGEIEIPLPSYTPQEFVPRYEPSQPKVARTRIAPSSKLGDVVPVASEPPITEAPITANHTDADGTTGAELDVAHTGSDGTPPFVTEDELPKRGEWQWIDQLPVAVMKPTPIYPDFAREAGIEGRVLVHILIGKDGRVLRAELDEKQHVAPLDQAALDAAKSWVFTPALTGGHAKAVWETIPFVFKLH